MKQSRRGYHILDKDLRRITYAETAQMFAFRPVLRLGLVVLVGVAILIAVMAQTGSNPGVLSLGAGLVVACWLGLAIGANDVANSLGPAVGAGAITLFPGLIIVAIAEIAGASVAGGPVTDRIATGIFDANFLTSHGQEQILMVAALIAAAIWITLATAMGLPVSTSHSIVGAIAGASTAALGFAAVHWTTIIKIASAWLLSPLSGGLLAAGFLAFITIFLRDAPDRAKAARCWLPLLVALMVGMFLTYFSLLVTRRFGLPFIPFIAATLICTASAGWGMWLRLAAIEGDIHEKPKMKHLFRPPLVGAVAIMAFAHGANDVGNIAGPLSVILEEGEDLVLHIPILVLLVAGITISAGTLLFGRKLVTMVGTGITRLNPVRAFCVSLATATTVLISSGAGLPVSTTHVAIGGIFGVGYVREWLDRRRNLTRARVPAEETRNRLLIRRSHVATISVAWLVTVPITALLGVLCYWLIAMATGV